MAVSDMESATSPRPKAVSRLEVTPPGAAAMIMTPKASSGASGQMLTRPKATTGRSTTCATAPTRKSRGCFATRTKSPTVSPRPSASMMNASAIGSTMSVTIPMPASPSLMELNRGS